ncbi:MAG TPA: SPOR domain-containing protein [Enhygromyxa sp.]|nr:SPOR domain-containing protein [Enhygromyxa sp.]
MREMHKWKDKVELSLDNRQIFFLFFGLSVIGCFVFALGIMTGRRLQWEPGQQAAALGDDSSLALLDATEQPDERFAFRQGLAESDAEALPPTRDPELPPRDEKEVRAERAAALVEAEQVEQREAQVAEVEAKIAEQQKTLAQATPEAGAAKPEPKPESAESAEAKGPRRFTLQMKAFSREEDANKLADKLRHNGHEVRVESHEVRGRTWHRVRLGAFDDWDEALAAKQAFEKAEHVIAYVVSL